MKKEIKDLIEISRFFGSQKEYTLAGGGNTSYKNKDLIWVKASGSSLATINEDGFAVLDRKKVQVVREKKYSEDEQLREVQVKDDLIAANKYPESMRRPSVETSFHEIIDYAFVVHMHPTMTNALMCSRDARKKSLELFGEEALYLGYAPGYPLFKMLQEALPPYRAKYGHDPKIIFLENHGVFVSSDNTGEIKDLYFHITETITRNAGGKTDFKDLEIKPDITEFIPALRMLLSDGKIKILRIRHNELHAKFYCDRKCFQKASQPFIPDIVVYCKGAYLYIEDTESPEKIINSLKIQLPDFENAFGYKPKILILKNYGIIAVEDTAEAAEIALDVYEDLLKISYYSEYFGGPHFLSQEDIAFLDNWEVENYRRKISMGTGTQNLFEQRICIVTGAAQGFGAGIATNLVLEGANVVIVDLNSEKGRATEKEISVLAKKNRVMFVQADISKLESIRKMIYTTVSAFGGIDLFISNAGILHAGSLEEMNPETFSLMTRVNYEGYFLCTRESAGIMKLQNRYSPEYFTDIIQINSKSGQKGSNRNFAYAGAKFGGIGLTQSFALELAPFKIKVNAIAPGNFFEGPLWSDEKNGLFVQYLRAGKVPGARTVEEVKAYYESQVPMNRGCRVEDVVKAIKYIVDQKYETGQAIPVTGGQIMLN